MMQHLFISFLLFLIPISSSARENPFFPLDGELALPFTTNIKEEYPPLKRATINLPSTARVIENITVQYKNLDGSIESKSIELNNAVDWHLPLFVSQKFEELSEKKEFKEESLQELVSLSYIKLLANSDAIELVTDDELLRDFLLPKPHRIVCDFKREIDIRAFTQNIKGSSKIKKFRIGNHKGYYRVVIELDGYYNYKLEKKSSGYLFKLL